MPQAEIAVQEQAELGRRVVNALHLLGYAELADVRCHAAADGVVLHGRCPSRALKHVAATVAAHIPGVYRVANQIEVVPPQPARWLSDRRLLK